MEFTRPTADELNAHLEKGGQILIGTYTKCTIYKKKHAGYFSEGKDGNLYVQRGRGKEILSVGKRLLVAVRFSREVQSC